MCPKELTTFLITFFIYIWEFVNQNLFTSAIGAFAGAYGGYFIVKKTKYKEDLLAEIRNTNTAIDCAFHICNALIGFKKQHAKPIKENLNCQINEFQDYKNGKKPFLFKPNFLTFQTLIMPLDLLQKQVFEKISLNGRPINLTTTLIQVIHSLNDLINERNKLIEETHHIPDEIKKRLFLGLTDGEGHTDNRYPSLVEAIYSLTDDGIFFSNLLCKDLNEHGEHLKMEYGRKSPRIHKIDFTKAVDEGLMPNPKEYSDWENMFVKKS